MSRQPTAASPAKRWIGLIISFPRKQEGDFTLGYLKQAETDASIYGDGPAATWEVNPQFDPTHPLFVPDMEWVTIEELNVFIPKPFEKEFLQDGADAMTKYMCQPPPSESGFFEFPAKITEAVDATLPEVLFERGRTQRMNGSVPIEFVNLTILSLPPKVAEAEYFMHGDPALNHDGFAVSVCHKVPNTTVWIHDGNDKREVCQVVVDFVLVWEPTQRTPVDLLNVDETLLMVARYYTIKRMTFDRWNSAGSIQRLIQAGIRAHRADLSTAKMEFRFGGIRRPGCKAGVEKIRQVRERVRSAPHA